MDNNSYTVTIELKDSSGQAGANKVFAGNTTQQSPNVQAQQQGVKKDLALKLGAWHVVKSFAVQQVNHAVSLVELRTGSRDMQDHANFYNNVIQSGVSILEATAVGAYMGSLPGALVGFTLSAMHKGLDISNKHQTLLMQQDVENRSLHSQYIRAGAQGSRGNNQ